MLKNIAYAKLLNGTQHAAFAYSYAVTIPPTELLFSGNAVRVQFKAPTTGSTMMSSVYAGRAGLNAGDFVGAQVQLTVAGQTSWVVPAGGAVWSDPVELALDKSVALVVRYTLSAGSSYANAVGVSGASLQYIMGQGPNGDTALGAGYSTIAGWLAAVASIEVSDSIAPFLNVGPVEPDDEVDEVVSVGSVRDIEDVALSDRMFAAGGQFAAVQGQHSCISLAVPGGKDVVAFVDQIEITADSNTEITLRAGSDASAGAIFNQVCNTNFRPGASGPKSRVRQWTTASAPETPADAIQAIC